jgi:HlyD family secretion protein
MNADVVFEVAQRTDVVAVPNAAIINPQDAVAAGAVLGLSEDAVNEALRGATRMAAAPAAEVSPGGEAGGRAAGAAASQGGAQGRSPECTALFQRMREAGGADALSEQDRAKLRECRPAGGRGRGGRQGGDGAGGPGGGEMNGRGRSSGENEVRPAVVFVEKTAGVEARRITIGLNDFDFTEVVNGLEPGDRVVLMSVARIQAQQQELLDRTRERAAGAFTGNPQMPGGPGGGGPRGGGGGGGGGGGRSGGGGRGR